MTTAIEDDISFMPATSSDGPVVPEGRWALELLRIEKAPPSTFNPERGPQMKWVFRLYADGVEGYPKGDEFFFNGELYEFFRTTSRANSPRAYARQYAEALLGRRLEEGEVPQRSDLIGRRMSAMLTSEPSENDPTRMVTKMSSLRPMDAAPKTSAPAPTAQVTADATAEDVDRALLISTLEQQLRALKKKDKAAGARAQEAVDDSDLDTAPLEDVQALLSQITTAIGAA
jgi:hypothetical protein